MDGTTTNQPTVQTPQVARRASQPASSEEAKSLRNLQRSMAMRPVTAN
ncbi:hypothetical protein WN943_024338 [Citrus x changshan-huyou]